MEDRPLRGQCRLSHLSNLFKTFIRAHNKALSVVAMGVTIAGVLLLVGT